jgi:hypothetical protein
MHVCLCEDAHTLMSCRVGAGTRTPVLGNQSVLLTLSRLQPPFILFALPSFSHHSFLSFYPSCHPPTFHSSSMPSSIYAATPPSPCSSSIFPSLLYCLPSTHPSMTHPSSPFTIPFLYSTIIHLLANSFNGHLILSPASTDWRGFMFQTLLRVVVGRERPPTPVFA